MFLLFRFVAYPNNTQKSSEIDRNRKLRKWSSKQKSVICFFVVPFRKFDLFRWLKKMETLGWRMVALHPPFYDASGWLCQSTSSFRAEIMRTGICSSWCTWDAGQRGLHPFWEGVIGCGKPTSYILNMSLAVCWFFPRVCEAPHGYENSHKYIHIYRYISYLSIGLDGFDALDCLFVPFGMGLAATVSPCAVFPGWEDDAWP